MEAFAAHDVKHQGLPKKLTEEDLWDGYCLECTFSNKNGCAQETFNYYKRTNAPRYGATANR